LWRRDSACAAQIGQNVFRIHFRNVLPRMFGNREEIVRAKVLHMTLKGAAVGWTLSPYQKAAAFHVE
jgi:hypothetical protein